MRDAVAILVASIIFLVEGCGWADASPGKVFVRVRVNANYVANPEIAAATVRLPLEADYIVHPGDTVSRIVSDKYQIGVSNAPEAYRAFENQIITRNNLSGPNDVASGSTIKVPDLPPLARTSPNPDNIANRLPKLSTYAYLLNGLDKSSTPRIENVFAGSTNSTARSSSQKARLIHLEDSGRVGAQEVFEIRQTTIEVAKALVQQGSKDVEILNQPITIRMADGTPGANVEVPSVPEQPLTANEQNLVRQKLAAAPQRRPVVFVLDDSWPDDAAFIKSRDYLVAAINRVRKSYKLDEAHFSAALLSAVSAPQLPGAIGVVETHSHEIQRSLKPLMDLEPADGRVDVIYVPLFCAQIGSEEILRELVELDQIVRSMANNHGDPVPAKYVDASHNVALNILANVDKVLQAGPTSSDEGVVEALIMLAHLDSRITHQPFLVNMSWTVPDLELQPYFPSINFGLPVTASGNEGDGNGTTVYALRRQFALRSLEPGDMLTVMNIDASGAPVCKSSILDLQHDTYGLGFSGSLEGTPCGGSSFASPRVAWLIAARESVNTKSELAEYWANSLKKEIMSMHDFNASAFNKIRFNVTRFFSNAPTATGS
ncbi:MAG: hypothetical protein JWR07_4427 [Nevskia sp.]|nr:hypothetical protein [Nevskia sp.]